LPFRFAYVSAEYKAIHGTYELNNRKALELCAGAFRVLHCPFAYINENREAQLVTHPRCYHRQPPFHEHPGTGGTSGSEIAPTFALTNNLQEAFEALGIPVPNDPSSRSAVMPGKGVAEEDTLDRGARVVIVINRSGAHAVTCAVVFRRDL
jgi:hypothetical protein